MLFYDLADPRELVAEAKGTVWGINQAQYQLSRWLPTNTDLTLEYRITTVDRTFRAATYRAWDTESVIGKRPGVTRVRGELAPISRKIMLTEYERLRLAALQRPDNDQDEQLVAQSFNDARNMALAVAARLEMARGELLSTGKIQLNEQGVQLTVDFGVPAEHRVAAGTAWSDTANADPIGDLNAWRNVYLPNNNGRLPGAFITSLRVMDFLQRNAKIRALYGNIIGSPTLLAPDQVNSVMSSYGLPNFYTYEMQLQPDTGSAARVIPNNLVIFAPAPDANEQDRAGETLEGVTAEAMELAGEGWLNTNEELPGIVAVQSKTTSPVTVWTEAVTVALPLLRQPQRILIANVG